MIKVRHHAENLLLKGYLNDPLRSTLSAENKRNYLIASLCIGVITLGSAHLFVALHALLRRKYNVSQNEANNNKFFKHWKQYHFAGKEDISYTKPDTPVTKEYSGAMKAMEMAMADTCLSYVLEDKDGLMQMINTLVTRYKDILEAYVAVKKKPHADQKLELYNLLRDTFANKELDAGFIGDNPLSIYNLIEGKSDSTADPQALFRNKLYFLYRMNTLTNEIMSSKKLQQDINAWLTNNNKGWQLETALIKQLCKKVPFFFKSQPLFWYGTQARVNFTHFLRSKLKPKAVAKKHSHDSNPTFAEAEKMARASTGEMLYRRYRTKFSPAEEMFYTGELPEREAALQLRKEANVGVKKGTYPPTKPADTSFAESPLEYKKRTQKVPWIPGKHYYNLHSSWTLFRYNQVVSKLALPTIAGISGTLDQSFTIAGILGFYTKEDLIKIRIIYLAWMLSSEDHSFHEIMQSSKTYNLEYTPGPDSYKQVKPGDEEFILNLQAAQRKRGYNLPSY